MELYYQWAHMTITAGHGADCYTCCFAQVWKENEIEYSNKPLLTPAIKLPYIISRKVESCFYLADKDEDREKFSARVKTRESKTDIPLFSRGRVDQE
jgi:hypothetical protein